MANQPSKINNNRAVKSSTASNIMASNNNNNKRKGETKDKFNDDINDEGKS
jgi:hypothetical protein